MARIGIYRVDGWERDYITQALTRAGHDVVCFSEGIDDEHVCRESFDGISVFVDCAVTPTVIDSIPSLKLITTRSTGFDHIDVAHARERGIALGYVPHYGEHTVAEFAMGLLLTVSRKLYQGIDRIKETSSFSYEGLEGFDLRGKTLGVVGTGRIGQHIITMAKGFGMNVIAYDPYPNIQAASTLGYENTSFDDLIARADIITLHVPYMPATHHLINADVIAKMKKGVVIINTARGPLIETTALVDGLQKGIIAGAGLDVIEEEGIAKDEMGFLFRSSSNASEEARVALANHILMDMPQVVITPHNAFNTREAKMRILDTDIANIISFFNTGKVGEEIPSSK